MARKVLYGNDFRMIAVLYEVHTFSNSGTQFFELRYSVLRRQVHIFSNSESGLFGAFPEKTISMERIADTQRKIKGKMAKQCFNLR